MFNQHSNIVIFQRLVIEWNGLEKDSFVGEGVEGITTDKGCQEFLSFALHGRHFGETSVASWAQLLQHCAPVI